MPRTAAKSAKSAPAKPANPISAARPARKANTRDRAEKRLRKMEALEPPVEPSLRPTRDYAGLQKIERLMGGLALRAANAYADARMGEGDKYVKLAAAGYREAEEIFAEILRARKVLSEKEQEDLILVRNNIKLLNIRIHDYAAATKDEAWRREHQPEWNPHPLGEDKQGFFARETY